MCARLKRLTALLCALALCAGVLCPASAADTPPEIPQAYRLAAQNSRFNLYLREDTLSIIVQSRQTGGLLYSAVQNPQDMRDNAAWKGFYQSGVVMEYIEDVKSTASQADFINNASEIAYTYTTDGFTARVRFQDIGIAYEMTLSMGEEGFCVTIPQSGIVEDTPERFTVAAFYVFPFLGHSYLGQDEGYMLIPDGQGALIHLEDNEGRYPSPFNRPVYGLNIGMEDQVYSTWNVEPEPVIMPVFGMVHTKAQIGFLGVIEQGDIAARVMAYPNGVRMAFDWVCAKYTYCSVYAQPTGPASGTVSMRTERARRFDIVQRFLLTDGQEATYAGLACAWRALLDSQGAFAGAVQRPFDVRVEFLGLEKENYVLGKRNVIMTSFAQAEEILSDLRARGVDSLSAAYRGWQEGGLTGGVPTDGYAPAKALGGAGGLQALFDAAAAQGVPLSLEADFLTLNAQTHPALAYSAFKKITSATFARPSFGRVYDTIHYLTPAKTLDIGRRTLKQWVREGVPGVSLTGFTQLMSDYYYKSAYHDTADLRTQYEALAADARAALDNTSLCAANAYLWRYAGALTDMPIAGSDYTYTDAEVPFLAIATSGRVPLYAEYVNFQANNRRFFLRLAEQGARPCFLVTWEDPIALQNTNSSGVYSSRYALYGDMIAQWYGELSALHAAAAGSAIVRHDRAGDMARVTWGNGTRVYLNFGEKPGEMDGVALGSLDYKVVSGDGQ